MYHLFLDDVRAPPDQSWVVARSVPAAEHYISEYGLPYRVSLDHDLGDSADAPALLHWLIGRYLDGVPMKTISTMIVEVHSANPVGRQNLLGLWLSFTNQCLR